MFTRLACFLVMLVCVTLGTPAVASQPVNARAQEAEFEQLQRRSTEAEMRGDFPTAIRLCLLSLQIKPNHQPTMLALSGLYGKNGQPRQQLVWSARLIAQNPKEFGAFINQGNAHKALEQDRAAKDSYLKAKALDPMSPIPHYSLGVLAQERNRESEAMAYFQEALKVAPDFEDALFNLAVTHANLGDYAKAVQVLNRLLQQNPDDQEARRMRISLDRKMRTQ